MKINIFKKITALIYLIIFSLGLLIPLNQSFAQSDPNNPLVISSDKPNLKQGETASITAVIYGDSALNFIFTSSPGSGTFSTADGTCIPKKDTTGYSGYYKLSCTIGFTSLGEKTLTIKASLGTTTSNEIIINKPPEPAPPPPVTTDTTYTPLAPLPGLGNAQCPDANGNMVPCINTLADKNNPCPFGNYLNIMIKIVIGFAAVLAMIMITMGGIEYMTAELISGKEEGKERITHALLGLLLALGAFLILNTINPQLLSACLDKLPQAGITITNFNVSGGLTFNGQPITVNFNTQAYPAAKIASQKTGVDTAFILAIFAQETSSGGNTGSCNYTTANMGTGQLDALKTIATSLNKDYTTINMSCAGAGSSNGGAIGLTQFIPTTWLQYKDTAAGLLSHQPDPWNVADALMMTSVKLKNDGGINDQIGAACKYFGNCNNTSINCGGGTTGTYGQCVMGKKLSIQQQITDAISKGTLTP